MLNKDTQTSSPFQSMPISWLEYLARFGYVIKGLVYVIIGGLALLAAFNWAGGQTTGLVGALQTILAQPFGKILLGVFTIGLVTYALWFVIRAVLDIENDGTGWLGLIKRFSYGFNGLGHLGLALIGVQLLVGIRGSTEEETPEDLASQLLSHPLGQWVIVLIAAIIAGVALYSLYDAYGAKFCEGLNLERMSERLKKGAIILGRMGRITQAIILVVIALFCARTALLFDPAQAQGLAGALAFLDQAIFGPWLLGGIALGLIAQGTFMFIEARYHGIDPDNFTLINKFKKMAKEYST